MSVRRARVCICASTLAVLTLSCAGKARPLVVGASAAAAHAPSPSVPSPPTPSLAPPSPPQAESDEDSALNRKKWKFASFFKRMKEQVRAHWQPATTYRRLDPDGRRFGGKDRYTLVDVALDDAGQLLSATVESPSGVDELDQVAIDAFRSSAPFRTPPQALVNSEGIIRFKFGFYFQVGGAKPHEFLNNQTAVGTNLVSTLDRTRYLEKLRDQLETAWRSAPATESATPTTSSSWQTLAAVAHQPPGSAWYTEVSVVLDGAGKVLETKLERSSGVEELDARATMLLAQVAAGTVPEASLLVNGRARFVMGFAFDRREEEPVFGSREMLRDDFARAMRKTIEATVARSSLPARHPRTFLKVFTKPDGSLTSIEVARSSGDPEIDQAWLRAARAAAPFRAIAPTLADLLGYGVLIGLGGDDESRTQP